MSIFSDVVDAVTPGESQEDRQRARARAREMAGSGDWLTQILDHHVVIEAAFDAVKQAADPASRRDAQKRLAVVLTGHSIAEEAVIYPAMAEAGDPRHARHGYTEQATVKMEMAELEKLDPMSREHGDKLEAIREAVAHHVYEEEGTWYPALRDGAPQADQAMMTKRYKEEFERYASGSAFSF